MANEEFKHLQLSDIDKLMQIEDERVQIAELDDVSRWIELALDHIPAFKKHSKSLLKIEEYFDETGLEGDDLHLWRAYRSLFAQRFSGIYDDILEVTDVIAADLFKYFIRNQQLKTAKSRFSKEAIPFTFLGRSEDYYFTYTHDLERPIAVISIPQGRVSSAWNWLAIPHEIGHNIFAHFIDYESELWDKIKVNLKGHKFSVNRINLPKTTSARQLMGTIWRYWLDELIADVFGVLFTGPSFAMSRQEDAIQAAIQIGDAHLNVWDIEGMSMSKHPSCLIRPLLANRILKELGFERECDDLNKRWFKIIERYEPNDEILWVDYKHGERIDLFTIQSSEILKSFDLILPVILNSKMKCFEGAKLLDIVQFDQIDYTIVRIVADDLINGVAEFERFIKPRHILAASRIAFEENPDEADRIHSSAMKSLIHYKKKHMED
jgi:hypothetical protein